MRTPGALPAALLCCATAQRGCLPMAAEIVERRRLADGGLAAVSAAADFSARLHADITYDYSARNVHEVRAPCP